jgi:lipopolysaccharide transport system permease protein
MISDMFKVYQFRDLVWTWTDRIVRSRYQQSVLGGLWMIVQPTATAAIFAIIFTYFVPINTGDIPYVVFSFVAVNPWMLLANSLTDMSNTLVDNMNLVTKIYFPRDILPISALLARLVDFFIASVLLLILILYFRIRLFPLGWLYLPIILIVQLSLSLGLGFILAAANVFFRDVRPLLTLIIQLWFYASPIIYPVSMVPEYLRPFYFLNPMAGILESYRAVLLYQTIPGSYLIVAGFEALIILIIGYRFFKRVEFQFADFV